MGRHRLLRLAVPLRFPSPPGMLRFPLTLRFRHFTISPQLRVTDAGDQEVCFVKQKAFRLKESVTVFRDSSQSHVLGKIEADRIIDWSARYTFTDPEGRPMGAMGRRGAKSLWRAHYDIFANARSNEAAMTIQEESVLVRMLDSLLGEIPILGIFTGFFFHPTYVIARANGTPVARVHKRRALLEGRFTLERLGELTDEEELEVLLSCLMMVLLERSRG